MRRNNTKLVSKLRCYLIILVIVALFRHFQLVTGQNENNNKPSDNLSGVKSNNNPLPNAQSLGSRAAFSLTSQDNWTIIYVVSAVGGVVLSLFLAICIYVRIGEEFFRGCCQHVAFFGRRLWDSIRRFSFKAFSFRPRAETKDREMEYQQIKKTASFAEDDDPHCDDVLLRMDSKQNADVAKFTNP